MELCLTDEEFSDCTSAELAALHGAWERKEDRLARRTALLATLQFNAHRGKAPPASIDDFMPQRPQTAETVAASQRAFIAGMMNLVRPPDHARTS